MSNKKLPKQIRKILTEDETIEKRFHLKGREIHATNKRLLDLAGRTVMDYDCAHISSIGYTTKRYWWLIILGIMVMVIGVFIGYNADDTDIIMGSVLGGLAFIIIGAIAKSESVMVSAVGVGHPVTYKGSKDELDSLLQIVRTKRLTENAVSQKETRDMDFVDTIRRLAQLRDEGILTQEELLWLREWHSPFELTDALGKRVKSYNRSYLHSSLGYKSAMKFEEEHQNNQLTILVTA